MAKTRRLLMQAAYGTAFSIVLPLFLWVWSCAAAPSVSLRVVCAPLTGLTLAAMGIGLLGWSWFALAKYGHGLPMNAFPPPSYVSRGPYAWFAHPIYVAFCGVVLGLAVATGSGSGQWLVFPTCVLGCIALVYGYEREDLRARFGALHRPRLALPPGGDNALSRWERLSVYLFVLIPWLALYEAIATLGAPPDARSTLLPFERTWPVFPSTEPVYASVYVVVALVPLVYRREALSKFCRLALSAMVCVFPLYLVLPLVAPPRAFSDGGALGQLLIWERRLDTEACAFPSFHVLWALIVADCARSHRCAARSWALLVAASCVTTGMHSLLDVAAALALFQAIKHRSALWNVLRRLAELVCNSWREWRLGPMRFISHGLWAGLGTTLGLALMGAVLGADGAGLLGLLWLGGLMGAALWGQLLEGSFGLSRPYGFYGGLLGTLCAGLAAPYFGFERMVALAACCTGAPIVQAFGRLRCLVQGCCHGAPSRADIGIRYRHPRSRVSRVPSLVGLPLHPTPLYSILWNVPTALSVVRLVTLHASAPLVAGIYLILNGAGRFVEEAYRGEPQTPIVGRLRLYQWFALGTLLGGAAITGWFQGPALQLHVPTPAIWLVSIACGLANVLALGVDFPESSRRFSRLA